MKFYKTNSGLGYNQYAILLQLEENNFLIVESNNEMYKVGDTCNMNDYEVESCVYNIKDSSLYNPLFEQFFNSFIKKINKWKQYYEKINLKYEPDSYINKIEGKINVLDDLIEQFNRSF